MMLGSARTAVVTAVACLTLMAAALPATAGRPATAAGKTASAVVQATGTADLLRPSKSDRDSAAIVESRRGEVDVPRGTSGSVAIETAGTTVRLGLPDTTSRAAVLDRSGTVVFADDSSAADVAVQATAEGARALVNIKDRSAPSSYAFPVDGPAGSRLVTAADLLGPQYDTGEVLLLDTENQALAVIAPAWAKDATGMSVPTRYRVVGNTLIQDVDLSGDVTFPVVADPSLWQITKCAAALTWFVGSNLVVVSKLIKIKQYINALGGFRKSAELLLRASTWEERLRIGGGALVGLASEVLGVAAIRNNCTG